MKSKSYKLGGKEYKAKEKYNLKEWGKIISLLRDFDEKDPMAGAIILLSGDNLTELLEVVLTEKVSDELYEEDFEEVQKILSDFFTRKNSLIKTGKNSLKS